MLYTALLILICVLILDLVFYIPIIIHGYYDKNNIYLYIYSLPIFVISGNKQVNLLKNKFSLEKILKTSSDDLKIIETINISRMNIQIKREFANKYSYIFYPLIYQISFINNLNYSIKKENSFYIKINVKILNLIKQIIKIRRLKNERTPNK